MPNQSSTKVNVGLFRNIRFVFSV